MFKLLVFMHSSYTAAQSYNIHIIVKLLQHYFNATLLLLLSLREFLFRLFAYVRLSPIIIIIYSRITFPR